MSGVPLVMKRATSGPAPIANELSDDELLEIYMKNYFHLPADIKNDIIYCQRALKSYIKVHQMVLDVFQQQTDADPQQKKRILDEIESEVYEINAEQSYLLLHLRRIIDEFQKMLQKNGINGDLETINAFISKEIVPFVNDENLEVLPITVRLRNSEEKLIEKYFEVQREQRQSPPLAQPTCVEIIDLDDDGNVVQKLAKTQKGRQSYKRQYPTNANVASTNTMPNGESVLRSVNTSLAQTSLLKPIDQRVAIEPMEPVVQPKILKPNAILPPTPVKQEQDTPIELPVSTNVRMSRMNLRQALKRAQAAVRGPVAAPIVAPPPPPPPLPAPAPVVEVITKAPATKAVVPRTRARKSSNAVSARAAVNKSPITTSSSGEGTPERGPTPPNAAWPHELEETRTKPEEYGQEMFLRMFDLFTPEVHAQMQQRRSKRRRRCVQNHNYHYGATATTSSEPDGKKKRKANFLLSPHAKKALPGRRGKRRSADKDSESNSAPPSRSASSSPDDKRSCNECLKSGYALDQCEACKAFYHPQCHGEKDAVQPAGGLDPKQILSEMNTCPSCKRKHDKLIKEEVKNQEKLQISVKELELRMSQEQKRRDLLQKQGKDYKIQMNSLFKIVNSLKAHDKPAAASSSATNNSNAACI